MSPAAWRPGAKRGTRSTSRRRPASRLWIGTSGYVYKDWRGVVYPDGLPLRAWLGFYASHFDTVELNSAFYRLPSIAAYKGWRAQVTSRFLFAVKASRFLTHMKKLKDPRDPIRRMLRRAGHLGPTLGPVLFQLPAFLRADVARLDVFLDALARQRYVRPLRAVLEVRHASWLEAPVIERLRAANVALCFHDWREQPVTGPVTADFVYVRRHGTSPRRYHGSYTEAMLREDAARIRGWRRAGCDVYVYFNNDFHGHAWRNALALKAML
ncbi:MAG TPA: DUF72 domain-containing protein [Terriglobales bacterium]|nr:DUF72 domain-containing protein [Terriglobales bacterium]